MNAIRNRVQLIGRLGQEPEIFSFEDGNKLAKFSMATDDSYKDKEGNKVERTQWHNVVVRGGLTKIVENYVTKGQEIAVEGKLTNRSYQDNDGVKRFITEVQCNELLLLGKCLTVRKSPRPGAFLFRVYKLNRLIICSSRS